MKHFILSIVVTSLMAGSALADGDVAKGEQVFKKCGACHSATEKTNKVGPFLAGVFGRKAATVDGYNYSDGMKAFGAAGAMWDETTLSKYLAEPKVVVPTTKMAFAGLKKDDERADLIAYLKTKM